MNFNVPGYLTNVEEKMPLEDLGPFILYFRVWTGLVSSDLAIMNDDAYPSNQITSDQISY